MRTRIPSLPVAAAATALLAAATPAQEADPAQDLLFGGCGGVYLLAEPGTLEVEVLKRDTNQRGRHTELRAILVGPDRRTVQEVAIPDDGRGRGAGLGPLQRARLTAPVERKGVYVLNVTVSQDRYGEDVVWGFRTSCARYLVETARGHKDERHREPIVLAGPDRPTTVCFLPRPRPIDVQVTGLRAGAGPVRIVDADGELLRELSVDGGAASGTLPADLPREAVPWQLELPSGRATITVDGLTQWDAGDPCQDMCIWSPDPKSWFPLVEHRWLLTPYHRTVYGSAGAEREVAFALHNNSAREEQVALRLEFPDDRWPVRLDAERVTIAPGGAERVTARFTVPTGEGTVHVRATPKDAPGFTTFSTLTVRAGDPPPLHVPLQLEPYRHENALFGYLPGYPIASQPYFDPDNRPYFVLGRELTSRRDGAWATTRLPGSSYTTKVAFDAQGDVYVLAPAAGKASLLHSSDGGRTFDAYPIPGRGGSYDIEQFSGHNVHDGPPPFVRFVRTGRDPKLLWRRLNDLELFVPRKVAGRIEIGAPVLLSKLCIGLSSHSGIPSSIVSRGAKVHVAWGEATDPDEHVPGVPTFVVTYDRETGALGEPALVGYGPPANDVHNSPSITIDGDGYLHVLIGTHGRPFQHTRSERPDDAGGSWTEPVTLGRGLRQTYVGFVCGKDGTLHTVFRLWRGGAPFPHSSHATLAYQRKRPGRDWEPPRVLVVAPFSEYGIFYHRLTIDREGRLFLSKDYWSTYWFYRNDQRGSRGHWRSLLMSPDGGETWELTDDGDLRR